MLNLNLIFQILEKCVNIGSQPFFKIWYPQFHLVQKIICTNMETVCSGICIWNGHMLQGDINTHWKVPIIDPPNFKEVTMVALSHQLRSLMKTTRRQLRRAACFTCIVRLSNHWNNHSHNIHLQSAPLYNVHNIQIFSYLPVSDTGQPGQ